MGFTEMLVLGIIALLVIGPKQLPDVARVIGRTLNELKRATGDLTSTFYGVKNDADRYMREQRQSLEKILEQTIADEQPLAPHAPNMEADHEQVDVAPKAETKPESPS